MPSPRPLHYIAFHKPYGVLSQFTAEVEGQRTLAAFDLPPGVYPAGRLDKDSEGLLLLTDDGRLIKRLLAPDHGHPRTHLAQVEHVPGPQALSALAAGVDITVGKKCIRTRPATVALLDAEPPLPPRDPPIRFRKSVPTAWIRLTLTEGKNRQVRRMTAAVGHPTLRLVRERLGKLSLNGLRPGEWRPVHLHDIVGR